MKAIAAMTNQRVIGLNGSIPWKSRRDMRFFKTMTASSKLVMGRKTFQSTGILPNRTHHVITNNKDHKNIVDVYSKDVIVFGDINSVDIDSRNNSWLCGGAEVYEKLLPACDDLYLTIVLHDIDGDVFMPSFEGYLTQQRIIKEFSDMWIIHYWRSNSLSEEAYREGFDYRLINAFEGDRDTFNCPYHHEYKNPYSSIRVKSDQIENPMRTAWIRGYVDAPVMRWENV